MILASSGMFRPRARGGGAVASRLQHIYMRQGAWAPLPPQDGPPAPPVGWGWGELLLQPSLWVGMGWVSSFRYAGADLVEHRGAAK